MSNPLKELRTTLLSVSHPERWLILADKYLLDLETMGEQFVLPSDHQLIEPILNYYAGDLSGWLKFIKGVRDRLEYRSPEYIGVHEFYKKVNVRWIQRRTRACTDVATELAVRKGSLEDNYEAKLRYAKRCIQSWKARRDNMLLVHRKASETGRVSSSDRERLLAEFWELIAEEVNNGEIPKA